MDQRLFSLLLHYVLFFFFFWNIFVKKNHSSNLSFRILDSFYWIVIYIYFSYKINFKIERIFYMWNVINLRKLVGQSRTVFQCLTSFRKSIEWQTERFNADSRWSFSKSIPWLNARRVFRLINRYHAAPELRGNSPISSLKYWKSEKVFFTRFFWKPISSQVTSDAKCVRIYPKR